MDISTSSHFLWWPPEKISTREYELYIVRLCNNFTRSDKIIFKIVSSGHLLEADIFLQILYDQKKPTPFLLSKI